MVIRLVPIAVLACGSPAEPKRGPDPTRVELAAGDVTFTGMCDASGAVALGPSSFVVADDESGVLRVYDVDRGGAPTATFDVSEAVLPATLRDRVVATDEIDIEGAARIGDVAYWIASHSRRKNGDEAPARSRFFATTAPANGEPIRVLGTTDALLAAIVTDPRLRSLAVATSLAPIKGGVNIEGLAPRSEGGVWIGFRSPLIDGKAVLLGLENPREMIAGAPPELTAPVLLPLDGLGIRAMTQHRGRNVVVAGDAIHARASTVYTWDVTGVRAVAGPDLTQFNAEAFVSYDARDRVMLLSDDGSVVVDGTECKRLANPSKRQFHGRWISLPPP